MATEPKTIPPAVFKNGREVKRMIENLVRQDACTVLCLTPKSYQELVLPL